MGQRYDVLASLISDLSALSGLRSVVHRAAIPSSTQAASMPIAHVWMSTDSWEHVESPQRVTAELTLVVDVYSRLASKDFETMDDLIDEITGAIYSNGSRSGSAIMSSIKAVAFGEPDDQNLIQVRIEVVVRYRRRPGA